ncbi:hypothetical protein T08_6706 [Trichinella sp. T8]|nr:hypothetical protein T08_6706 [Trichinella sp. T8]
MTNYKWGPVPDNRLHGDDMNDYEALKADLKKMFILLKSEMSFPAVVSERTNRREVSKYQTVLIAVVKKELTNMDEARRITLKTILIEVASYGIGSSSDWTIVYLIETGDSCVEGATKPSLPEDTYQQKHQATTEARLEKLEECCMRPLGNQTTRERLQPLSFFNGSSRKADDPLTLATEVIIDDTTITQLKIQGFSIQFLLDHKLLFQPYPKRVWDNLDINDLDDIEITY